MTILYEGNVSSSKKTQRKKRRGAAQTGQVIHVAFGPGGGRLLRVARRLYLSRSLGSHSENAV